MKRHVWGILAAAAGIVGLVVGLIPLKIEGVSCGPSLGGGKSRDANVADITSTLVGGWGSGTVSDQCQAGASGIAIVAWALIVLAIVLAIVWLIAINQPADEPALIGQAAQLEHLARLHNEGSLSDDEFATAKARVLDI